jgi:hypothetical protein
LDLHSIDLRLAVLVRGRAHAGGIPSIDPHDPPLAPIEGTALDPDGVTHHESDDGNAHRPTRVDGKALTVARLDREHAIRQALDHDGGLTAQFARGRGSERGGRFDADDSGERFGWDERDRTGRSCGAHTARALTTATI